MLSIPFYSILLIGLVFVLLVLLYVSKKSHTAKTFKVVRQILCRRLEIDDQFLKTNGKIVKRANLIIDDLEKDYRERKEKIDLHDVQAVAYELILQVIRKLSDNDSTEYGNYFAEIFRHFADERIRKGY